MSDRFGAFNEEDNFMEEHQGPIPINNQRQQQISPRSTQQAGFQNMMQNMQQQQPNPQIRQPIHQAQPDVQQMRQDLNYQEQRDAEAEVYSSIYDNDSSRKKKIVSIIAASCIVLIILIFAVKIFFLNGPSSKEMAEEELSEDEKFLRGEIDATTVLYSDVTREKLKIIGKSEDEIQTMMNNGITEEEALAEFSRGLDILVRDRYMELKEDIYNVYGESFKKLLKMTWLYGKDRDVTLIDKDRMGRETIIENCDYEKVPLRGYQCFIRVNTPSGRVFFMELPPEDWKKKSQTGNIVVSYRLILFSGSEQYIQEPREVEVQE